MLLAGSASWAAGVTPDRSTAATMLSCSLLLLAGTVAGQQGPEARGPPLRRHHNIHLDLDQERE